METLIVWNCMNDIIHVISTKMDEKEHSLSAPEKRLSFAQKQQMQCLCGVGSSIGAENAVFTAPYSETRVFIDPATSYNRRIKLLTVSGLVAGITPTSVRKQSSQQTLDFAFSKLGGCGSDDEPKVG